MGADMQRVRLSSAFDGPAAHLEAMGRGLGNAAQAFQVEADAALWADSSGIPLQCAGQGLLDLPQHVHAVPCIPRHHTRELPVTWPSYNLNEVQRDSLHVD